MYKIILSWHTIKIKQYNILFLTKICCQRTREYTKKDQGVYKTSSELSDLRGKFTGLFVVGLYALSGASFYVKNGFILFCWTALC